MGFTIRTSVSVLFPVATSGGRTLPAARRKKEVPSADPVLSAPSSTRRSGPRLVCLGDVGYVQGMSDLCAPIYVVMKGDEVMTFWCFVALMERMVRFFDLTCDRPPTDCEYSLQKQNFLRDQSGMKKQLATLQQLVAVMDPELYKHFGKVLFSSDPQRRNTHFGEL
jgi:hypothetical protein